MVALGVLPPMLLSDHAVPFAPGVTARDGRVDADRIRELNALARQTYSDVRAHAESAFTSGGARLDEVSAAASRREVASVPTTAVRYASTRRRSPLDEGVVPRTGCLPQPYSIS